MKQATEYVHGIRYKLRMMGLTCDEPTYVYGDNQSVLANTSAPASQLKKKSNSIVYHYVREGCAQYEWRNTYVNTHDNTADLVTKALPSGEKRWKFVRRLLRWLWAEKWKCITTTKSQKHLVFYICGLGLCLFPECRLDVFDIGLCISQNPWVVDSTTNIWRPSFKEFFSETIDEMNRTFKIHGFDWHIVITPIHIKKQILECIEGSVWIQYMLTAYVRRT